jgi:hypothetical protein
MCVCAHMHVKTLLMCVRVHIKNLLNVCVCVFQDMCVCVYIYICRVKWYQNRMSYDVIDHM